MSNRLPKLIRLAIGGAIALVVASVVSHIYCGFSGANTLEGIHRLVNLDAESSFPAAFATLLLALTAILAITVGSRVNQVGGPIGLKWVALAAGLAVMSVDEWWSYHERLTWRLEIWAYNQTSAFTEWLAVLAMVASIVLFSSAFARFAQAFPEPFRNRLQIGAALFAFGAVGLEFLAHFTPNAGLPYLILSTMEESLELAGVIIVMLGLIELKRELPSHITSYAERVHQTP